MRINPQSSEKISSGEGEVLNVVNIVDRPGKKSSDHRFLTQALPVHWHSYCTEHVIRGERRTKISGCQVGMCLSPRLPHLVASEEAVKEMETDGSHCKKGIQQQS